MADDHLWKYWVHSKIGGCYPPLPNLKIWEEVQIDWEDVCVDMEVETKKWSNVKDSMRHIVVNDVHFASVDTVLLVNVGNLLFLIQCFKKYVKFLVSLYLFFRMVNYVYQEEGIEEWLCGMY